MNQSADPTTVYVTQQVTATIASLSIIAGTIVLAMAGFIHDGEIVTLLMGSVGAHMVIQKATLPGAITTTGAVATTGDVTHIDAPPAPTVAVGTAKVTPTVINEVPTTTTFP